MNSAEGERVSNRLKQYLTATHEGISLHVNPKDFCIPDNALRSYDIYAFSDRGLKRDDNQDAFLAAAVHAWCRGNIRSYGVLLVADGMGGGKGGEIASAAAVETSFCHLVQDIVTHARSESETAPDFSPIVSRAIEAAHAEVRRLADGKGYKDMGTTLVLGVISKDHLIIGNMGDSRLYKIKSGRLVQETEDHSLVGEIVKAGMMTKAQARGHKLRSAITRAVGIDSDRPADIFLRNLADGEILFLCTDGIHGVMDDEELSQVFQKTADLRVSAGRIMQTVLNREAPDNFTLILNRCLPVNSTPDFVRLWGDMEGKTILRVRLYGEKMDEFELILSGKDKQA